MTQAYIIYKGDKIPVIVESYFQGLRGRTANVIAVTGYPFLSADVQAQGKTHGSWNCNGYRVAVDAIMIEDVHPVNEAQRIERGIDWQLDARAADADDEDNRRTMYEAAM